MEHRLDAYTFVEFCHAHRISRSTLYNLLGQGLGPRVMNVRGRRLISNEAAAEWRSAMENRSAEAGSPVVEQRTIKSRPVAKDAGEARQ
jgi:hypothetical protein